MNTQSARNRRLARLEFMKKAKAKEVTGAPVSPASESAQTPTQPKIPTITPEIVVELQHERADATQALEIYGGNPAVLSLPDNMPEHDFLAYGKRIGKVMEFASWRIGDYVNYGKKQYGYKDYAKISDATGLSSLYLRGCASVADRVPPQLRHHYGMEKFRLMLNKRDENETIEALVERLGKKSAVQLREMSAGSTGTRSDEKTFLASSLQDSLVTMINGIASWDNDRIKTFAVLNRQTHKPISDEERKALAAGEPLPKYTNLLETARNVLAMLADQVEKIDAETDAREEAAREAANEAHDKGELDSPNGKSGKKGEKPF